MADSTRTQVGIIGAGPGGSIQGTADALRSLKLFSDSDLRAIERDNAVRLIPRLANL